MVFNTHQIKGYIENPRNDQSRSEVAGRGRVVIFVQVVWYMYYTIGLFIPFILYYINIYQFDIGKTLSIIVYDLFLSVPA